MTTSTSFDLKPLHEKYARSVSRKLVPFTFPEHVVRLRNVEDIRNLPNQRYGLPVTSNFPLVDAIVQPNVLLQMTVSAERHKGAVDRLEDIRAGLSEKDRSKHMMVFVVPKKNFNSFKYQDNLPIPQFVLCPMLNTIEQSKKRKRKGSE
jgi:hypothetical protein